MKLEYRHLIDESFDRESRVWIYQASRLFSLAEALTIEELLSEFIKGWHSHRNPVKGAAYLFFGQFIVLMADERATGVSGCSTDSSVHLIKEIEKAFLVTLFDRTTLAFFLREKVELLPISQLQYAADNGFIFPDSLYFNNLVQTKVELENNWIIPVKDSWLAKRILFSDLVNSSQK